jgi:hypothetical protein
MWRDQFGIVREALGKKQLEDPSLPMDKANKKNTLPTPLVQVVRLANPKRYVLSL